MDFGTALLFINQANAQNAATATANRQLDFDREDRQRIDQRAIDKEKAADAKETTRKASGAAGLGNFRSGLESQLRQGVVTYEDAISQARGYGAKFDLDPEEVVSNLTNVYTKDLLPGRRATGITAAYEDLLRRPVTEEEKKTATTRFEQGYYTSVQDLKDSILKGPEYQEQFNNSYLENYYDTMYGKQGRDAAGKKTGIRSTTFDSSLLPTYAKGTESKAGVTIPTFGTITGQVADLDRAEETFRDTRKYLYSAGLTNLQGDIDKETQKLKNEGARDIAKIGAVEDRYKLMSLAFS